MKVKAGALKDAISGLGKPLIAAVKRFGSDQCSMLAASIAFYSAFSLAPTLLIVLAVAGWVLGEEAASGQLFVNVRNVLGNEAASAIQAIVEHAPRSAEGGIAALMSVVLVIIGASATFSSLNTALNVVFPDARPGKRSSIAVLVRVRLISFGLVLGLAFLMVVSLVLDTAVTSAGKMLWGQSTLVVVGDIVQLLLSLGVLSLALAVLLKFLPDAPVKWRDALSGGVTSAVLFSIGKKLFALYLAHAGTASAFGAAGSLAVLMMWLYFVAAVLLLGAELAAALSSRARRSAQHGAHSTREP
jgi:membrane protein